MSDRELLELAAKAAGIKYDAAASFPKNQSRRFFGLWLKIDGEPYEGQRRRWNPLTSDGDALRLAVRLNIDFKAYDTVVRTWVGDFTTQKVIASVEEICGVDPYAATRRAITRAAAEIGKEMQCTS